MKSASRRIDVRVVDGWFAGRLSARINLQVDHDPIGRTQKLGPIDLHRLRKLDLFYTDAGPSIEAVPALRELTRNLRVALSDDGGVVEVVGGRIADVVPWEALDHLMAIEQSEVEARRVLFAPVRITHPAAGFATSRFAEPMRIAAMFGHPEGAFDPADQQHQVRTILSDLASTSSGRIAAPTEQSILDLASRPESRWSETFAEAPNVVLYFGHGRGGANPSLRVRSGADGWVPLGRIAEIVADACLTPYFWAFMACSLGEGAPETSAITGPPAFEILREKGALAMLAMRAEIRPAVAAMIMREVIMSMAVGESLPVAAARGRRAVRHAKRTGTFVDWAAAAVWSVARSPSHYVWGVAESDPSAFVGLQLLRATAQDFALGLEAPGADTTERAARWCLARRVRLIADGGWTAQIRMDVASVLVAEARRTGATVVLIELRSGTTYPHRLADWAAGLRAVLVPNLSSAGLARALLLIEQHDPRGLDLLLSIPDVVVVFSEPPGHSTIDEAVWDRLLDAPLTATIVVCDRTDGSSDQMREWAIDTIDHVYRESSVDTLFGKIPRALTFLSIIHRPISLNELSAIAAEDSELIGETPGVIIDEPAGGVVLTDAARRRLVTLAPGDAIRAAHASYLHVGANAAPRFFERGDWAECIEHMIGAGLKTELVRFVGSLVEAQGSTWPDADWIRLGSVLKRTGDAIEGINAQVILKIASVLVDRQQTTSAMFWLEERSYSSTLDEARRQAMMSEVWKAEAATQRMWDAARRAKAICDEEVANDPLAGAERRASQEYEMNLARLELYFAHNAEAARSTFARLVAAWRTELRDDSLIARPLVAALRNLAECLFEFEPFAGQPDSAVSADAFLGEALVLADDYGALAVDAEIIYSSAKLAEVRTDGRADRRRAENLLGKCIQRAEAAHHHVLRWIAEVRRFRLQVELGDVELDAQVFRGLVQRLVYLSWHAWALRSAVQARLWAAKRLAATDEFAHAISFLHQNVRALAERPNLTSRSDRTNATRSFAGLAVLEGADAWSRFQSLGWASAWLREHRSQAPESIWLEVQ